MLLLFLSIFFQYDFLHCDDKKANVKNDFMDYSITEFWWNSTPGIDQTDQITPQYSFLPTPIGHGELTGIMDSEEIVYPPVRQTTPVEEFYPFPNLPRPSYPFEIEEDTVVPTQPSTLPEPWHIQYPGLTPPPNFPSDYRYPTIFPYTSQSPYIPSPTGPTPKGPSFTLPEVNHSSSVSTTFPSPEPLTEDPIDTYMNKWIQKISSYAAADTGTPINVVPTLGEVFNYDYRRFPVAIRRIPKIMQVASSKLKSSVFEDQTRSILRENVTVTEKKEARDSVFENEASSYNPDIRKTTPRMNESNFLTLKKMLEVPATIPKGEWQQSNQTMTTIPTTVKEILRQTNTTQSYFEMKETLQEGHMMVFLIELTRLIATKEGKAVRDVVKHADQIIYGFHRSGQLMWFGKPLIDVTWKVTRFLKESKIDVIQNHATNLHHMLSQRHQELSAEVNTILEYANTLYDNDEGRLLFDALKEFAAYPNISLTGYWLCNSLIHDFLRPFRRLKDTRQRQKLMDSVNLLLKTRLSSSRFDTKPPLRDGDVKKADGAPCETKLSPQTEPVTQTVPHSNTTLSPRKRKRKRKRHHRSHKRKRERKRYYTHRYLT